MIVTLKLRNVFVWANYFQWFAWPIWCNVQLMQLNKKRHIWLTSPQKSLYVMLCAICYHFFNLKNVKNTHGGLLLLVRLQALVCNFSKSNTPPWVFFKFFKLYKWYQIAQSIIYIFLRKLRIKKKTTRKPEKLDFLPYILEKPQFVGNRNNSREKTYW